MFLAPFAILCGLAFPALPQSHNRVPQSLRILPAETTQRLRQFLLGRINEDRDQNGSLKVELDELASRIAEEHCKEMLEHGFLSHWSRDGRKPYMRYSMAGGTDAVSENLVGHEQTRIAPDEASLLALLDRFEDGFMAEKPPDDGHRRNILAPEHTHVGLGFAVGDSAMYIAQEFVNRYVKLSAPSQTPSRAASPEISGEITYPDARLYGITIYYEPLPQPMTIAELNATRDYNLPKDGHVLRPKASKGYGYEDGETGEIEVFGQTFRAPLSYYKQRPGVYTIAIWITARGKTFLATTLSLTTNSEAAICTPRSRL